MPSEAQTMTREDVAPKPSAETSAPPLPDAAIPGRGAIDRNITIPRGSMVPGIATGDGSEIIKKIFSEQRPGVGPEVTISGETAVKHFNSLKTYADSLVGADGLEAILKDPARATDRILMDRLCDTETGGNGEIVRRTVSQEKIIQFLQTSRGIATSTMLLEQESLLIKMGIGMDAVIRHQAGRGRQEQSRNGKTTLDTVPTIPGVAKVGLRNTLLALEAAGYIMAKSGKSDLEFKSDDELVRAVKAKISSTERAYLKARAGINLDGIRADGSYESWYEPDIANLQRRVTNADNLRRETLDQLGFDKPAMTVFGRRIERNRQIRYPEEFIFDEDAKAEDIPVAYLQEIYDNYGKTINAALAGVPADAQRYVRLREMAKARSKVMVRYMMEDIKVEEAKQDTVRETRTIGKLKEKGKMMREKPDDYLAAERAKHTTEKTKADDGKKAAEDRRTEQVDGPEGVATRAKAVSKIIDELTSDEIGVVLSDDIEGAITTRKKELNTLIDDMEKDVSPWQTKLDERFKAAEKAEEDARKDYSESAGKVQKGSGVQIGTLQETIDAARVKVDAKFKPILDAMQAKYDKYKRQLEALEAKEKEYTNAVGAHKDSVSTIRGKEPQLISDAEKAANTFTAMKGINMDDIRTKSVDELVGMLPVGLKDEEKLKTVIQAKAYEVSLRTPLPKYQQDALDELHAVNPLYTSDYVLRLDKDEIYSILVTKYKGMLGVPTTDQMEKARKAANAAIKGAVKQFSSIVQESSSQEVSYYEAKVEAETKALEELSGDKFKEKIDQVEAAITILDNATSLGAENTLSKAYVVPTDPDKLDALMLDLTIIAPGTNGYTEAETALGQERYVFEWYRLLFPQYMDDPKNRDKMFNAITAIFPPNELKNHMVDYMAKHPFAGTGDDLRQLTTSVLHHVRDYALTL